MGIAALFVSATALADGYYWGRTVGYASTISAACAIPGLDTRYTYNGYWSFMSDTRVACSYHGPWGNENIYINRYSCPAGESYDDASNQCGISPPPVECEYGVQIKTSVPWSDYANGTAAATIAHEGCEYVQGLEQPDQNECYVALNGQTFCHIAYGASGDSPAPSTEMGTPVDTPVEQKSEWEEQPVQSWAEEAPLQQEDSPLPGDTTTIESKTETLGDGDQIKVDNIAREYIEIEGNTYTKTTTTTTTTKSDGTEIVETTVEYSNTGTTTTITDLDDPSQSTTHTAGGGTGSATTTTTTNPDGSSSSSTTQDGDPQEAEEEGEQEQEKFTDQPTQEGILDPFDTLIEGVGQGDLGSAPSYQWSMSTGIGCQAIPWAFGGTNGSWDGYCPFWDQTIRPALAWMVYILTVIALIGIWRDTTKRS